MFGRATRNSPRGATSELLRQIGLILTTHLPYHSGDNVTRLPYHTGDKITHLRYHTGDKITHVPYHTGDKITHLPYHTGDKITHLPYHTGDKITHLPYHTGDKIAHLPYRITHTGDRQDNSPPWNEFPRRFFSKPCLKGHTTQYENSGLWEYNLTRCFNT